jgi:N-acetylmuramoyl-L-alanine amidase
MIGTILLGLHLAAATPAKRSTPVVASPATASGVIARRHTVVVDAGHGGPDAGMTGQTVAGRKISEKTITLAVAMRVGEALEAQGVRVVYTRTRDTLIALSAKAVAST